MKLIQKLRKNRKGFSLVELIVVIAIMAVLVGVIAPNLIRNIEKSRESRDIAQLDDFISAVEAAAASEKINEEIADNPGTYKIEDLIAGSTKLDALEAELKQDYDEGDFEAECKCAKSDIIEEDGDLIALYSTKDEVTSADDAFGSGSAEDESTKSGNALCVSR